MLVNPYQKFDEGSAQQRSNFHTHAGTGKNTCGHYRKREVIHNYKVNEYGILCISNHDRFSNPKWFRHYAPKMLIVPGYEYSRNPHVVCVGTHTIYIREGQQQKTIDKTNEEGGFTILAHPHWMYDWYWEKERLDNTHGFAGIEVMNGSMEFGCLHRVERENRSYAGDVLDYLLSKGRLKWAFANDDFHRWVGFARAWTMIYCDRKFPSLVDAVKRGHLYASSGPILMYLKLEDGVIRAKARSAEFVEEPMLYRFIGLNGELLHEMRAMEGEYKLKGDEKYVRLEIYSVIGGLIITNPLYDPEFFGENREK